MATKDVTTKGKFGINLFLDLYYKKDVQKQPKIEKISLDRIDISAENNYRYVSYAYRYNLYFETYLYLYI